MTSAFRVSLLLLFALYWGGLTFYTGFAVRILHDVLSDPIDGGMITQRVTAVLQVLGVLSVVLMAINSVAVTRKSRKYGIALIACVGVLACALIGLFIVHSKLDAVIDLDQFTVTDRDAFDAGHRRYNQLTTIQWLACLVYLSTTVYGWRAIDTKVNVGADI